MVFTWPTMLWAFLALPLLGWGYARVLRRQRRVAARLADHHLLAALVRPASPWRRHLPVGFYLFAVALLLLAMARPIAAIPLPVNRAAVILAIDTSQSMMADDVTPSRLEGAKRLARDFVRSVPGSTQIGLVVFSDYGTLVVPPSTDRRALEEALADLRPRQATAVGSAIAEALRAFPGREALLGDRLRELRGPTPQSGPPGSGGPGPFGPGAPGGPQPAPAPQPSPLGPPPRPEDLAPAAIVIFSDGVSNLGADPRAAAALATEGRVKIYAVGMGRQGGTVMQHEGRLVLVPFDGALLEQVARQSGGEYFSSGDEQALRRIARQLGRVIGWERRRTEITSLLAGTAGVVMLMGAVLSMAWFRRVP